MPVVVVADLLKVSVKPNLFRATIELDMNTLHLDCWWLEFGKDFCSGREMRSAESQ